MRALPAVVVCLAAAPALPCTTFSETLSFLEVPDAVVPTNVVWLAPRTEAYDRHVWWLRPEGTEAYERMSVSFDDDVTRVRPSSTLQPGTTYELLLTRSAAGDAQTSPFDDGAIVEGAHTITTSTSDDALPPPTPTLVSVETKAEWGRETSCGITPGGTNVVFTVAPDDETYALRLERVARDDVEGSARVSIHPHNGAPANADGARVANFADDESGALEYRIVAIDNAGNESEPVVTRVDVGLPGACAATDGTPAFFAAALLALARRRARRRRSA